MFNKLQSNVIVVRKPEEAHMAGKEIQSTRGSLRGTWRSGLGGAGKAD